MSRPTPYPGFASDLVMVEVEGFGRLWARATHEQMRAIVEADPKDVDWGKPDVEGIYTPHIREANETQTDAQSPTDEAP